MGYFLVEQTIFPSVYRLEDPRGVFLALIIGERAAFLADTGMGIGDAAAAAREITGLPLITANTHGHIDHIGGNYQFERVWQSPCDFQVSRKAMDERVKTRMIDLAPDKIPEHFDRRAYMDYAADNLIALAPDTRFDLGGLTVIVVPLPSHTPGSMGFLCPELRLLLSGDSISPVVYLVFEESSTIKRYIEVLRETKRLPFEYVFSSHNREELHKDKLGLYIMCAEAFEQEQTVRFRNPLFPDSPGNMFIYRNPEDRNDYAALVYTPEKLVKSRKE